MDTVADVVRAGAEILVAGNAVFGKGDQKTNAEALLKAATEATCKECSKVRIRAPSGAPRNEMKVA